MTSHISRTSRRAFLGGGLVGGTAAVAAGSARAGGESVITDLTSSPGRSSPARGSMPPLWLAVASSSPMSCGATCPG